MPRPELERLLRDETTVFTIRSGEDEHLSASDSTQWKAWWDELTTDWRTTTKK